MKDKNTAKFLKPSNQTMSENYRRLLPAKRILDEKYNRGILIKDLAKLCAFSETHFRRLFFSTFGLSPVAYRIGRQIEASKSLLRSGEYSIQEVAEAVGFTDANYFSRLFRKHTGMSPGAFIQCHKDL